MLATNLTLVHFVFLKKNIALFGMPGFLLMVKIFCAVPGQITALGEDLWMLHAAQVRYGFS